MMNDEENYDPWELIETDLDHLWTLHWLKCQREHKKISPDEARATFCFAIIILKENMKARGVKGDDRRTAFMHDILRNNNFTDMIFYIIYPREGEDLLKWLSDNNL